MALGEEGSGGIPATMLVGPAGVGNSMPYPYPVFGGMGGGSGAGFGNDGGWIILVLIILLVAAGGWGNSGNGGGFGQPVVINDGGGYGSVQRGFDQAAIMAALTGIQSGICSGFSDVQQTLCNGFSQAEIAENSRQMANMQQMFSLSTQFSDCCCENRLATVQTQNIVQSEGAATRSTIQSGVQSVLDKLCQLELDGYKRENDQLRSDLSDARYAARDVAQTAQIRDGQVAAVTALVNELRSCPIPSQPVYGSQPIFTCPGNNNGCGCGGNGF